MKRPYVEGTEVGEATVCKDEMRAPVIDRKSICESGNVHIGIIGDYSLYLTLVHVIIESTICVTCTIIVRRGEVMESKSVLSLSVLG